MRCFYLALIMAASAWASGETVRLRMDEDAWAPRVLPSRGGAVETAPRLTWSSDPKLGKYFVMGPSRAARFGARFEYKGRLPVVAGQLRGWYKTTDVLPYTAAVSILFQVPGGERRPRGQFFPLGPSAEWTEFVLPIRRAPAGAQSVSISVGLGGYSDGRIAFAGLSVSSEPFRVEFPEDPGRITRPAPPAKFPAEGRYRIAQANGAWWLVTPDGRPMYSTGTDGPRFEGMERGRGHLQALRRLGFNSLAGWTHIRYWAPLNDAEQAAGRVPPAAFLSLQTASIPGDYDRLSNRPSHPYPDPFDPRWAAAVRAEVAKTAALVRGKPWFAGFFADNEVNHMDLHRHVYTPNCSAAFRRFLEGRYPDIGRLNAAWGTSFASFEELIERKPDPAVRQGPMYQDFRLFKREIVRQFIKTVMGIIREEAPGHLVFSNRLMLGDMNDWVDVLDLYSAFDAVGVNIYPANLSAGLNSNERAILELVHKKSGRPVLVPEWSVPALDSGLYDNPAKLDWSYPQAVDTQQDRARQAAKVVIDYYNMPFMIGAHWFIWYDFDSETRRANRGLFKRNDEPWVELQEALAGANRRIAEHLDAKGRR